MTENEAQREIRLIRQDGSEVVVIAGPGTRSVHIEHVLIDGRKHTVQYTKIADRDGMEVFEHAKTEEDEATIR